MLTTQEILTFTALLLLSSSTMAQRAPSAVPTRAPDVVKKLWAYSFTLDGIIVPDGESYANPEFFADRGWLHLEARYNYENLRTGSLWVGYNFNTGTDVVFNVTPLIGGVFGRSTGVAPGVEASVTYKQVQFWISNEYVFDTGNHAASFYYSWPQLTYSPKSWLRIGAVAQHTKTINTRLSVQPGLLLGFSHKRWEFTAYEFNAGSTDPTTVLELGVSF